MTRAWPTGIAKTATGWRISLRIHGRLRQQRFKRHYTLDQIEAKLADARKTWRVSREPGPLSDSFAADVVRYLTDYFTGRPGALERKRHLELWTAALETAVGVGPSFTRDLVTKDHVARILNGWRAAGLAAETCNKRRTALLALYHALDGKDGSNPVRAIPKFRPPDPLPRGLAYDQIEKALEQLPACKTRARLKLMAYLGMRPSQIMRLLPDHWDHRRHLVTVPGTSKGRAPRPYVIPLSKPARLALIEFDTVNAWGRFSWAPMGRLWKEAWIAAQTGQDRLALRGKCAKLPAPVPYDLRHSFGTQIFRDTGDLKTTKEMLGHAALVTTERYMLAAVGDRKVKAMKAFEASVMPRRRGGNS